MSRHLPLLSFAAAISVAVSVAASAVESGVPEAALAASATDAPSVSVAATAANDLPMVTLYPTARAGVRVGVPQRDLSIAAAPEPEPAPAPKPTPEPVDTTPPTPSTSGGGDWLAAGGTSVDPIGGGGTTIRFSVEVEAATGIDPATVTSLAEQALYDQRSWASRYTLKRGAPGDARIRILVATPATVDRLCAKAGLNTGGWLSCWNGSVAAINVNRWTEGVSHIDDLDLYRRYVINHEFGHGLGKGHVDCGGTGRLADVMQQQTKSLSGCRANEWAYPD